MMRDGDVQWRMDWGGSSTSGRGEMKTSGDSSRDQTECSHCGHVLLESQLNVIRVSWSFVSDTDTEHRFKSLVIGHLNKCFLALDDAGKHH